MKKGPQWTGVQMETALDWSQSNGEEAGATSVHQMWRDAPRWQYFDPVPHTSQACSCVQGKSWGLEGPVHIEWSLYKELENPEYEGGQDLSAAINQPSSWAALSLLHLLPELFFIPEI
jgi:hypothetical protein